MFQSIELIGTEKHATGLARQDEKEQYLFLGSRPVFTNPVHLDENRHFGQVILNLLQPANPIVNDKIHYRVRNLSKGSRCRHVT